MMLFIVLPEEETGFYLMRLNVVLHLANCDHMRYSVCTRLTKLFVASVNKCYSLFPQQNSPFLGAVVYPKFLVNTFTVRYFRHS